MLCGQRVFVKLAGTKKLVMAPSMVMGVVMSVVDLNSGPLLPRQRLIRHRHSVYQNC